MPAAIRRLVDGIEPGYRLPFVAWLVVLALGLVRLVFKIKHPIFDLELTQYGAILGIALVALGLPRPDALRLVIVAIGATMAALSGVVLIAVAARRPDELLFGMPLAIVAAPGLGVFCHAILHARPALARRGMTAVALGALASLALYGAVLLRANTRRGDDGTVLVLILTIAAAVVVIGVRLVAGRKRRRGRRRAPAGDGREGPG